MSESTQLTVQSLGDAVKDRVRKAMMDAIPDTALEGLIQAEFKSFFEDKQVDRYSNNLPTPSGFKQMVKVEIEVAMRAKIKQIILDKVNVYDVDGNKALTALVEELAPAAMRGTMTNIAYQCVNALKNGSHAF